MTHLINSQQVNYSDPITLDAQVKSNIHVVINVANQFKNNGLTFIELMNKGTRGLAIATRNYDQYSELDFNAYAIWYIRQAILQGIMENQLAKSIPLNKIGLKPQHHFSFIRPDYYFQREPSSRDLEGIKKFQKKISDSSININY